MKRQNCSFYIAGLFFLSFFILFSPLNNVFAETELHAGDDGLYHISTDTTWTKSAGPYVIYNDVSVDSGSILTIEAGTEIKLAAGVYINVLGKLIANGTESEKVSFTSLDSALPWGAVYALNGGSYEVHNADVSYADSAFGAYHGNGSLDSVSVHDCKYGLDITDGNFDVKNSSFTNMSRIVADIYDNSHLSFTSSSIENPGRRVFRVTHGSTLNLSDLSLDDAHGDQVFEVYRESSVNVDNLSVKNFYGYSVAEVYQNSLISITNSTIEDSTTGWGDVIEIFDSSHLTLTNSTIKNTIGWSAINVGDCRDNSSSTVDISDSVIDGGTEMGVALICSVTANISNTKITNFLTAGVESLSNPVIRISNSEISGNDRGIESYGGDVEITDSIIKDNLSYGIYNLASYYDSYYEIWVEKLPIKADGNWWGDKSGPFNATLNGPGLANPVSSNVEFSPWLKSDPKIKKKNPVIIIPGIMGTHISQNYGDNEELWPNVGKLLGSFTDEFLNDLSFNTDGTENADFPMTIGDIVRKVELAGQTVTDTFDGLISTLIADGYTEGTDLFVFPYDWRKSDSDDAVLLKSKIDEVLAQTGGSKVDIIAHSMGGLIASKYVADNTAEKVDKLIFIGTPHLGAPKAFKALMYGDDMGIKLGSLSFLHPPELKKISQNFPSVFDLLPSQAYSYKYIYDMTATTSKWLDYDEVKNFIINHGGNESLFSQAESLHASTDTFDLSGADVYNFSGCGTTKTIGSMTVKKKKSWTSLGQKLVDDYSIDYVNGDETVPLVSAVGPFGDRNYYVKGFKHSELPSADGVPETIFSILSGVSATTTSNISKSDLFCDIPGQVVSTHSPVTLDIYDDLGNHTGPVDGGDIEYGIEGVSYDIVGTSAFAFLPEGRSYRIVIHATDIGAYDFYITKLGTGGGTVSEAYWNEIPLTTLSTNSEINISSTSTEYVIETDQEGDGIFESTTTPSSILSATTSEDLISPQSTSTVSNGIVSLSAVDDNSGILKIEYSFDGNTWNLYTKPFSAYGKTVSYFATDNAGNIESFQTITIPNLEVAISSGGGGGPIIQIPIPSVPSVIPVQTGIQSPSSSSPSVLSVIPVTHPVKSDLYFTGDTGIQSSSSLSSRRRSGSIPSVVHSVFARSSATKQSTPILTASVIDSRINIPSIITTFFHNLWSHIFSFFKHL